MASGVPKQQAIVLELAYRNRFAYKKTKAHMCSALSDWLMQQRKEMTLQEYKEALDVLELQPVVIFQPFLVYRRWGHVY